MRFRNSREEGAALVVAILVLAILTVIGIALMLITSTESKIAANEWSVNRAFYSADAGLRWADVQMNDPTPFMTRAEFRTPSGLYPYSPFGVVRFQMPSHRHGSAGLFSGGATGTETDIEVRVQTPGFVGRRYYRGGTINIGREREQFTYSYEARSTAEQTNILQYSKALVADIDIGPLPGKRLPWQPN